MQIQLSHFLSSPSRRFHATLVRSLTTLLLATLVVSCGDSASEFSASTFYYNDVDSPKSLDPAVIGARSPWWIGDQIFVGLVGLDSALRPVPLLAKSWTSSPDGLVWTFTLRTEPRFADDPCFPDGKGRRVTAEDVRYSFERICNPASKSTGFWIFNGKVKGANTYFEALKDSTPNAPQHVEGFKVIDDTTFSIELVEPFAPFLSMLSMPYCYVVPREAVEKYGGEFGRHPVGAGAFKLQSWKADEELVLARNNNYFERDAAGKQLPYLDSVFVKFLKDQKTAFMEFEQGKLDAVSTIDPALVESILNPDGKTLSPSYAHYRLFTMPAMSVDYYGFMLDTTTPGAKGSPFATNRYLRLAINHAIDREQIVQFILKGRATPALHGPIPPGTPGFSGVKGYTFDLDLARRYLDSAGYPGGQGLPEVTLQIGENEQNASIADVVQQQLKSIGLTVQIKQVTGTQHREMTWDGKLPFWRANWQADYPDAENFLALFYSKYSSPPNTTHYRNPRVDSLYKAALAPGLDLATRAAIYGEAERAILADAPWVPMHYGLIQRLTQPWVEGYTVDPLDRLQLTRVRKSNQAN